MSHQIFIAIDGSQQGPYTVEQLSRMAAQGQLPAGTLCWYEGLPQWTPVEQVVPATAAPVPPPVAPVVPGGGGRVAMEIVRTEFYQMPRIVLENAEVVVEAGAMHYMRGAITLEAKAPSVGGFVKSKLTREKAVRPRYRGTGELFLVPSFGEYEIMELTGETWILDKGAFLASEPTVELGVYTNKAFSGFFGGEGFFQTQVSGTGTVLIHAPGPLQRIELANDQLVVDGSFAVGRTAGLEYTVERAAKGLFSSWISGEGLVSTFRGTGTVLLAPVPNRYVTLLNEFGGIRSLIRSIGSKG
ncbi:MAG TPA: DUF4339 domain-containing protein, partial [Acidobacteria bacterium]|nr:DUF4339 domain-containing protein [Acidobacteriota bacterium]